MKNPLNEKYCLILERAETWNGLRTSADLDPAEMNYSYSLAICAAPAGSKKDLREMLPGGSQIIVYRRPLAEILIHHIVYAAGKINGRKIEPVPDMTLDRLIEGKKFGPRYREYEYRDGRLELKI